MSWADLIIQGALLGGYYALLAGGLSFLYGVMRVINLAHGSLAVVTAYAFWVLAEHWQVPPLVLAVVLLPLMSLVGWVLYRLVFERSLHGGTLIPILSTFGLATVLDNVLFQNFGADTRSLAPYFDTLAYDSWTLPGDIIVGELAVIEFVLAVLVLGGLHLLLMRTSLGRQIRATSEDEDAARIVGVNTRRIHATATAMAFAMVAAAGIALGLRATFDPYAGAQQLIFAFEAVVMGGAGSLWGTLIGGVTLGIAQSVGARINPQGFLIAGHLTFLAVLLARISAGGHLRSLLATQWARRQGHR
ncbi:MAG TPA: branched-chain amino acid ABC transporter permease [Burkholderiaceae bacterium]|nr:branched-chain amino acid ABC transporter permease [Burkholderiaceae bacterium]